MKNIKRFSALFLSFSLILLILLTSGCTDGKGGGEASQTAQYAFTLSEPGDAVDLHTELQLQYILGDYRDIADFADGMEELSRPNALTLEWSATPLVEDACAIVTYTVELSESADFASPLRFSTKETAIDVYNLKIGTNYCWRVTATLADGQTAVSDAVSFSTADIAPRNLYVEGVTNIRDVGGWSTTDGLRVKQGMLYRTGRFNKSDVTEVVIEITDDGILTMREELGIKTEIDIRRTDNGETGGITSSPLGNDVNYYSIPMDWRVDNILTDNAEAVAEIFSILADKDNYPIAYHCNIGTDRTGLFAFLINGLVGVSEEDLYRDYLFSNFGKINTTRSLDSIQKTYIATIKSYPGTSFSEQIRNCLIDLGVAEEDVDAVTVLMSEYR